ncbi:MAG: hypothetical protein ACO395_08750 [Pontimonas sp.]
MICNIASDIVTKATVWTVTDHATGRFIQCVPAHKVRGAMRQLSAPVAK